ncbi:hypothetical protein ACODT5_28590 [Streptomyces sp. 5.8]|uniref:hypothetical protein n=1 Tax=Streptomyces sp. 5.8 TaxID=3406571 RepID=UPI003BB4C0EE
MSRLASAAPRAYRMLTEGDVDGELLPLTKIRIPGQRKVALPVVLSSDRKEDRGSNADHAFQIACVIAGGIHRAGGSWPDFHHLLLLGPHKGGAWYRERVHRKGYDDAIKLLQRVWDRVTRHISSSDPIASRQDAITDLLTLRERAESMKFTGRKTKRVLLAHVEIALKAGGRDHQASVRQLSEEAGVSTNTVSRADTELQERGLLRRTVRGRGSDADEWLLLSCPDDVSPMRHPQVPTGPPAPGVSSVTHPQPVPVEVNGQVMTQLMSLDAFAHRGLADSGLTLVSAMCDSETPDRTASEWFDAAGLQRRTGYRAMGKLVESGIVEKAGEIYQLTEAARTALAAPDTREAADLWEETAITQGTAGVGERRKLRHHSQRERWKRWLEGARDTVRKAKTALRTGLEAVTTWTRWGSDVIDTQTGQVIPGWRVADDGHLIWDSPEPPYEVLIARHAAARAEWEEAA